MSSDQIMTLLGRLAASLGWTLVGVLLFYGGQRLYDLLDPIDYRLSLIHI